VARPIHYLLLILIDRSKAPHIVASIDVLDDGMPLGLGRDCYYPRLLATRLPLSMESTKIESHADASAMEH
jgi:hypothetical protein